jgi:branched-chain amino acid transport system substrate-binding protein
MPKSTAFRQEYQKSWKRIPGMVASFAYDGMNLLIEAIKRAGAPDREKIQESLKIINYEGVTGLIRFDEKGNRLGPFKTTELKNGIPVIF